MIVAAICTGSVVGVPCGIAAGVIAGLFDLGGAVLLWCDADGSGVNINVLWGGFTK